MSIKNATDAHWLREQLGHMSCTVELHPITMEELRIVLLAIASGEDWTIALRRKRFHGARRSPS